MFNFGPELKYRNSANDCCDAVELDVNLNDGCVCGRQVYVGGVFLPSPRHF